MIYECGWCHFIGDDEQIKIHDIDRCMELDQLKLQNEGMRILLENFASNYHLNQSHKPQSLEECLETPCQKAVKYLKKRICEHEWIGTSSIGGMQTCTICRERRMKQYVPAPKKIEHCSSPYCIGSDRCLCQCADCLAIVNF